MQWARTKCVDQDLVPSRVDNPMHPLPLIYAFPPSKVGLLPDLFDLGETASLPQSPGWACVLLQAPRSVFSLTFDVPQTKFIAFLAPLHQCLAR